MYMYVSIKFSNYLLFLICDIGLYGLALDGGGLSGIVNTT